MSDWLDPPPRLTLAGSEIHLWRSPLDVARSCRTALDTLLSVDEQARASRYRFDGPRRKFTAARGVLRMILSRYLDVDPRQVQLQDSPYGKPELADRRQKWLQFSLAHSGDWVIYALSCGRPVGVDLEKIHTVVWLDQLVEQFFAPAEQAVFAGLSSQQKLGGFYSAWTRKEAYVKARGLGLNLPLNRFAVTLAPDVKPGLLADEYGSAGAEQWSIRDVAVAQGYAAAMAVCGPAESFSQWHWHA